MKISGKNRRNKLFILLFLNYLIPDTFIFGIALSHHHSSSNFTKSIRQTNINKTNKH